MPTASITRAEFNRESENAVAVSHPHRYEKILVVLFLLTLPLSNPWVRGDGVGYYAFARALLIEHRLDFTKDWLSANNSFRAGRVDAHDHILATEYTANGHLDNHFAIGPAILWAPFLLVAHLGVQVNHVLGGHIPADGFRRPTRLQCVLELLAMAFWRYGFHSSWAEDICQKNGRFLPLSESGLRVLFLCICISILPGPILTLPSWWLFFCATGIARVAIGIGRSG